LRPWVKRGRVRRGWTFRPNPGGAVDAVVDTASPHFFDPETGVGIYDIDTRTAGVPDIHQS
jgi:hypothetical protein